MFPEVFITRSLTFIFTLFGFRLPIALDGWKVAEERKRIFKKLFQNKRGKKYSQLSSSEDSGVCVPVLTPLVEGLGPRDRRPFLTISEFRSFRTILLIFRLAILTDFFSTIADFQDKFVLQKKIGNKTTPSLTS